MMGCHKLNQELNPLIDLMSQPALHTYKLKDCEVRLNHREMETHPKWPSIAGRRGCRRRRRSPAGPRWWPPNPTTWCRQRRRRMKRRPPPSAPQDPGRRRRRWRGTMRSTLHVKNRQNTLLKKDEVARDKGRK